MRSIPRIIFTGLLLFSLLPLLAQEKSGTVYTFRFVPDRDMFYVPYNGNDVELARLEDCVERYRAEILAEIHKSLPREGSPLLSSDYRI